MLATHVRSLGLQTIKLQGVAGDCLYESINWGLGSNFSIKELRKIAGDFCSLSLSPENWAPDNNVIDGPVNLETYLADIYKSGFGDEYTLTALSQVMGFNYTIITADGYVNQICEDRTGFPRIYLGFCRLEAHYFPLRYQVSIK